MNRYSGILETWKQALIVERARCWRLQQADLEDAQQIIAPKLLRFCYDPKRGTGQEESAIRAIIDTELMKLYRNKKRAEIRFKKLCNKKAIPTKDDYVESKQNNDTYAITLNFDVHAVLNTLTEDERRVCRMLSEGHSYQDISYELGTTKYNIQETIDYIRQRFLDAGFSPEWFTL